VGKQSHRQLVAYLPLVLGATFLVAAYPVLLVWWLRGSGLVSSGWVAAGVGAALSFGISCLGGALWKTRTDALDILFGELMLWGWVQRWRAERRLSTATDLLGLTEQSDNAVFSKELSNAERAQLLGQLATSLESQDPYTHGHSRRVARHSANIAKRMGLSRAEVAKVRAAAAMHDVGKVKTPVDLLHKKGRLTDEEFATIKLHPLDGAVLVRALGDDELTDIVRHHHERIDGTGYPYRLAGDDIPLGARIIAVADSFDAITSTRSYRAARAHKAAIDILRAEAGAQLDADAVRAFCACYDGRRPLAIWTILANAPQRLASLFGGGLSGASAASVANVMLTAAATAALSTAAVTSLVPDRANAEQARPVHAVAPTGHVSRGRGASAPGHRAGLARHRHAVAGHRTRQRPRATIRPLRFPRHRTTGNATPVRVSPVRPRRPRLPVHGPRQSGPPPVSTSKPPTHIVGSSGSPAGGSGKPTPPSDPTPKTPTPPGGPASPPGNPTPPPVDPTPPPVDPTPPPVDPPPPPVDPTPPPVDPTPPTPPPAGDPTPPSPTPPAGGGNGNGDGQGKGKGNGKGQGDTNGQGNGVGGAG
jgi:hypothetical protein